MALLGNSCGNAKEAPVKPGQLKRDLRQITLMKTSQHLTASFGQHSSDNSPSVATQGCSNILPGTYPENSPIFREALRLGLPHHLVLKNVLQRIQTHGNNYVDMKELVSDLFTPKDMSCPMENQEVPMETNQLEDVLMMNTPVVKEALRLGVPPHLIKPKVRAKILSNKVGYSDVHELLTDLNVKLRKPTN